MNHMLKNLSVLSFLVFSHVFQVSSAATATPLTISELQGTWNATWAVDYKSGKIKSTTTPSDVTIGITATTGSTTDGTFTVNQASNPIATGTVSIKKKSLTWSLSGTSQTAIENLIKTDIKTAYASKLSGATVTFKNKIGYSNFPIKKGPTLDTSKGLAHLSGNVSGTVTQGTKTVNKTYSFTGKATIVFGTKLP